MLQYGMRVLVEVLDAVPPLVERFGQLIKVAVRAIPCKHGHELGGRRRNVAMRRHERGWAI